jgi:hypothetical protein
MSSTQEKLEEIWKKEFGDSRNPPMPEDLLSDLLRLIDSAKREAVRAYIEPHLQACRDYNGRDYCKNCGLTEQSEESE